MSVNYPLKRRGKGSICLQSGVDPLDRRDLLVVEVLCVVTERRG